jgi:hypothetical protein
MGLVKPPGRAGELARIRAEGKREVFDPLSLMKEQAMRRAATPDPDRKPDVVHPSEMCKTDWCIRATYYRMIGMPPPPREFSWVLENIFEEGNDTHTWFQSLLTDTDELFGSWQCRICERWEHNVLSGALERVKPCAWYMSPDGKSVAVPHMWEYKEVRLDYGIIAGKSDGGVRDTMLEFKTVGMGTLRVEAPRALKKYYIEEHKLYNLDAFWKDLRRPFPGHIRQGNVYLWLARQMGLTQFERMTYVYKFKANQQTKSFSVKYSEDVMAPLLDKVRLIEIALERDQPPACEFGGCEQCRAYEGGGDDEASEASSEPEREARRVVTRGSARAGEARAGDDPAAPGRRAARAARRADGPEGPGADDAVHEAEPVGRVPRLPAQRGPGRRAVRRNPGREDRRASADT